jgi:hypothetical protein
MRERRSRTQDDLRQMEKHYREQGFSDGWAKRPAGSRNAVYQQAWRRGLSERQKADDAAA